jgi:hypothetical protein
VTSVSAVLPDGRSYPGTISGGRGFAERAWAVLSPDVKGIRLVFKDAAGREIFGQTAPGPLYYPAVAQPRSGGDMIYHCASCQITVNAYLLDGHVGFWVTGQGGGVISPVTPSDNARSALAGTWLDLGIGQGKVVMVGYAPMDATRVKVRLQDGHQYSVPTLAAPWPGSDVRLWVLVVPESAIAKHMDGPGPSPVIARAYGASGQIGAEAELGLATE